MKVTKKVIVGLVTASLLLVEGSMISYPVVASAASVPTATKSLTITKGKKGNQGKRHFYQVQGF